MRLPIAQKERQRSKLKGIGKKKLLKAKRAPQATLTLSSKKERRKKLKQFQEKEQKIEHEAPTIEFSATKLKHRKEKKQKKRPTLPFPSTSFNTPLASPASTLLTPLMSDDDEGIKTRRLLQKTTRDDQQPKCTLCKQFAGLERLHKCATCRTSYHLRSCLKYVDAMARQIEVQKLWNCAKCVRCSRCDRFIDDPLNVECWACVRAWHGICKPSNGVAKGTHFGAPWYCPSCAKSRGIHSTPTSPQRSPKIRLKSKQTRESESVGLAAGHMSDEHLEGIMRSRYELHDRFVEVAGIGVSPRKLFSSSCIKTPKSVCKSTPENTTGPSILCSSYSQKESSCRTPVKTSSEARKSRIPRVDKRSSCIAIEYDREIFEKAFQMSGEGQRVEERAEESVQSRPAGEETPATTVEQWVYLGRGDAMKATCSSAYKDELFHASRIFICQFCLQATHDRSLLEIHWATCDWTNPPGNEIYRDGRLSFFEVDGAKEKWYCRNLCLLAKLFISSKTLHHEVDTFLFYVLCECTSEGYCIVGYFSKEKNPSKNNNLSCLLTLPNAQRMGYGRLLIDMSYVLSRYEHKIGSPEHPLSDLGILAYRGYWRSSILCYLRSIRGQHHVSVREMSLSTRIHPNDIMALLLKDNMIQYRNNTYYIKTGKRGYKYSLAQTRRRMVNVDLVRWEPNVSDVSHLDPLKLNYYV